MQKPSTQDRLEIYELYARYSWALDTGDTDGYVELFTEDAEATEETRDGTLEVRKGRSAIRELVLKFHVREDFPGHQPRWRNSSSTRPGGPLGSLDLVAVPTHGPPSTAHRNRRICIGADTSGMSWRKSMVCGEFVPRQSWVGDRSPCPAFESYALTDEAIAWGKWWPVRESWVMTSPAQRSVGYEVLLTALAECEFRLRTVRSERAFQLPHAVHPAGSRAQQHRGRGAGRRTLAHLGAGGIW